MRIFAIFIATLVASGALADTCVRMQGSTLISECQACVELMLRQRAELPSELFTGDLRTVRLEAGSRETLPGSGRWAIVDFRTCR